MKKKRFSIEQIVAVLKQAELGTDEPTIWLALLISAATVSLPPRLPRSAAFPLLMSTIYE